MTNISAYHQKGWIKNITCKKSKEQLMKGCTDIWCSELSKRNRNKWSAYLDKMDAMGLSELLELKQKGFDMFYELTNY